MIVRNRPSAFQLFFIMRGSIVPRIKWQVLCTVGVAVLVTMAHGTLFNQKVTLTPIPFTLIGLALAIFLGFRNTASYDRWWEGRKLWGELVIRTRSLGRLIVNHVRPAGDDAGHNNEQSRIMVRRLIAFAYVLKHHLRGTTDDQSQAYLSDDDVLAVAASVNVPDRLLRLLSRDVAALAASGRLDPMLVAQMEDNLTALAGVQAGCERIRHTPLPFSYSLLLHRTAYLYCFALPFGLVDTTGFMTPFVVGLVSYTFFGLDAIGDEIEEPFGLLHNDLPLEAMCRRVEIDLLEATGEVDLPAPLQPVDYCLM
jgi:ion channel-forming bestrophin family protein